MIIFVFKKIGRVFARLFYFDINKKPSFVYGASKFLFGLALMETATRIDKWLYWPVPPEERWMFPESHYQPYTIAMNFGFCIMLDSTCETIAALGNKLGVFKTDEISPNDNPASKGFLNIPSFFRFGYKLCHIISDIFLLFILLKDLRYFLPQMLSHDRHILYEFDIAVDELRDGDMALNSYLYAIAIVSDLYRTFLVPDHEESTIPALVLSYFRNQAYILAHIKMWTIPQLELLTFFDPHSKENSYWNGVYKIDDFSQNQRMCYLNLGSDKLEYLKKQYAELIPIAEQSSRIKQIFIIAHLWQHTVSPLGYETRYRLYRQVVSLLRRLFETETPMDARNAVVPFFAPASRQKHKRAEPAARDKEHAEAMMSEFMTLPNFVSRQVDMGKNKSIKTTLDELKHDISNTIDKCLDRLETASSLGKLDDKRSRLKSELLAKKRDFLNNLQSINKQRANLLECYTEFTKLYRKTYFPIMSKFKICNFKLAENIKKPLNEIIAKIEQILKMIEEHRENLESIQSSIDAHYSKKILGGQASELRREIKKEQERKAQRDELENLEAEIKRIEVELKEKQAKAMAELEHEMKVLEEQKKAQAKRREEDKKNKSLKSQKQEMLNLYSSLTLQNNSPPKIKNENDFAIEKLKKETTTEDSKPMGSFIEIKQKLKFHTEANQQQESRLRWFRNRKPQAQTLETRTQLNFRSGLQDELVLLHSLIASEAAKLDITQSQVFRNAILIALSRAMDNVKQIKGNFIIPQELARRFRNNIFHCQNLFAEAREELRLSSELNQKLIEMAKKLLHYISDAPQHFAVKPLDSKEVLDKVGSSLLQDIMNLRIEDPAHEAACQRELDLCQRDLYFCEKLQDLPNVVRLAAMDFTLARISTFYTCYKSKFTYDKEGRRSQSFLDYRLKFAEFKNIGDKIRHVASGFLNLQDAKP